MNRRDLFKTLAAVPVAAAVAPLVIANDGVALNSAAHPGDTMALGFVVTEDAPVDGAQELNSDCLETMTLELPLHEWHGDHDVCIHCGVTRCYVEDNPQESTCWSRVAAKRTRALAASMKQTFDEHYNGPDAARIFNQELDRVGWFWVDPLG